MPNTFIKLDVPRGIGAGIPAVVGLTGHPKTFGLSGSIPEGGRYIIEGSNDGGSTWDILLDEDGTQTLFTSRISGVKTVDCIVEQVRVRSERIAGAGELPTVTMGAPPASGANVFRKLDVPATIGEGAPLDLGLSVGPLKTLMLRGPVPPLSRYTILASMDGVQFDEVAFFTSDQQGARSIDLMCRFLRVRRTALGPSPVVTVGAEGLLEPGTGGGGPARQAAELSVACEREFATAAGDVEEVMAEYAVPLSGLDAARFVLELSGIGHPSRADASATFRARLGGAPGAPDGAELAGFTASGSPAVRLGRGEAFDRPSEPVSLVKVTGRGVGDTTRAVLRGFVLRFRPAA